jgi:hypothetical protein
MAKITNFAYCENTQNEMTPSGPKLHLVGPMQVMLPMFIPGMFTFSIFIAIMDLDIEIQHNIKFIFRGPDSGEPPIFDTGEITLPGQIPVLNLPEDMRNLMLGLEFTNVVFRKEGIYSTDIFFDGELLGNYPIKAKGIEK